jgi:hypothetical protein
VLIAKNIMTERELQAGIIAAAREFGHLVYHTYDSRRSHPGFPDLTIPLGPRLIFAELKTEKGKLTTEQAQWLKALSNCKVIETYLWRPSDLDDIYNILR